MGVVSSFINRVQKFSTIRTKHEQDQLIRTYLSKNDYPKQLINRLLHRPPPLPPPSPPSTTPAPSSPSPPTLVAPTPVSAASADREQIKYMSIPYIHTLSPAIKTVLQTINPSVKVTARSMHNTRQLFPSPKDPVIPLHKYNLIYRLSCLNCPACYVGMTTNNLKKRLAGHQTTINTLESKLNIGHQYNDAEVQFLKGRTALIEHCIDHQHRFDLANPKILDHTFKKSSLPILEMCHITTTPHTVNRRTDTDNLNRSYTNIISSFPNRERALPSLVGRPSD